MYFQSHNASIKTNMTSLPYFVVLYCGILRRKRLYVAALRQYQVLEQPMLLPLLTMMISSFLLVESKIFTTCIVTKKNTHPSVLFMIILQYVLSK